MAEKPLEGWKQISAHMGWSVRNTRKYAWRRKDPLPVLRYFDRVVAFPSALEAWIDRHRLPLQLPPLEELDQKPKVQTETRDKTEITEIPDSDDETP